MYPAKCTRILNAWTILKLLHSENNSVSFVKYLQGTQDTHYEYMIQDLPPFRNWISDRAFKISGSSAVNVEDNLGRIYESVWSKKIAEAPTVTANLDKSVKRKMELQ